MPPGGANCRWVVNKTNREYVEYVSRIASLPAPLAQTLINRGIKTPEQIDSFLNPGFTKLSDPFELPGMADAVQRISAAVRNREKVFIHGDYDADGVTATAIMVETLKKLGIHPEYYIPDRVYGYGLSTEGIRRAREYGASLLITVDCGITSIDSVNAVKSLGIDVIITDHHEPQKESISDGRPMVPEATAVINPKLMERWSPATDLSGAGVAFKLAQALLGNSIDNISALLDLAAIGTAADVVPIVGDNRILIKEGLKLIQSAERAGIKALKEIAGIKPGAMKSSALHFMLIPRINAAGRIADATAVVKLLLTDSSAEAAELAEWLNGLNVKRQQIGESVYDDAMEFLRIARAEDSGAGAFVVGKEGWHAGVLGIVAARITDAFYRPSFVFSFKDNIAKGSARSIPAFDVHEGLGRCKEILTNFGGHKQAAGLSLHVSNLDNFRNMISSIVLDTVTEDCLVPTLSIDAVIKLSDVNMEFVKEIVRLEPFGYGNEEPIFGARRIEVMQSRVVGNRHLKMSLKHNGKAIDAIGFDLGGMIEKARPGRYIDAAFLPTINEWDGGKYLQLNLKAVRESSE